MANRISRFKLEKLLLERGMDIRNVQQLLGHASRETTDIYIHFTSKVKK